MINYDDMMMLSEDASDHAVPRKTPRCCQTSNLAQFHTLIFLPFILIIARRPAL